MLAASGWSELGGGGAQFADRFYGRKDFLQTRRQDKSNIGLKEESIYLRQFSRIVIIPPRGAAMQCKLQCANPPKAIEDTTAFFWSGVVCWKHLSSEYCVVAGIHHSC